MIRISGFAHGTQLRVSECVCEEITEIIHKILPEVAIISLRDGSEKVFLSLNQKIPDEDFLVLCLKYSNDIEINQDQEFIMKN